MWEQISRRTIFRWNRKPIRRLDAEGSGCCLRRPDIFKTQLRALVRASAYGNLGILYPMIMSVDEIRQITALA